MNAIFSSTNNRRHGSLGGRLSGEGEIHVSIYRLASRFMIAAVITGIAGGGISAFLTERAIDVERRTNVTLQLQHEALREEAFELSERAADAVELGLLMSRSGSVERYEGQGRVVSPPSRSAGHESIMVWLASEGAQLEAVTAELSAIEERVRSRQVSASEPMDTLMLASADAGKR